MVPKIEIVISPDALAKNNKKSSINDNSNIEDCETQWPPLKRSQAPSESSLL